MKYLGDFAEDQTVRFSWSTNAADGASITRATDGTVSVYKDGGATQSTAGVTDTEDFDSLTGIHHCAIVTTDAFYVTGSDYSVILSAATIDGETVNAVLAEFSIENRTTYPKADVPTNFSALGIESDGDLTKVNTLDGHTAQTGDSFARIGAAGASLTDLGGMSTAMKDEVNAECDTALTDYDGPTNAEMVARTLPTASYFDPATDTVANVTLVATTTTNTDMRGTDSASTHAAADVWSVGTRTVTDLPAAQLALFFSRDSGTTYSSAVAGSVVKEIADNASGGGGSADWTSGEKENIRSALGVTGTKTAATGGQLQDMQGSTFDTSTDSLEAIRNRGDTAWITGGGGGSRYQIRGSIGRDSAGSYFWNATVLKNGDVQNSGVTSPTVVGAYGNNGDTDLGYVQGTAPTVGTNHAVYGAGTLTTAPTQGSPFYIEVTLSFDSGTRRGRIWGVA